LNNKIFFKIAGIIVVSLLIYILFITLYISPKISEYLVDAETNEAKSQLKSISTIVNNKEKVIKDFKLLKIENYKNNIKNISNIAINIMKSNHQLFLEGKISKEKAHALSYDAISKIEYGFKDDYLFILDKKGTLVFHPDKRYSKKNIYHTADANGKLFIPELIRKALKNGSTYTRYFWSKLNSLFISEKITYSIYFEPFDLIISSGVYIENIRQELEDEKLKFLQELTPIVNSIVLGNRGYTFIIDEKGNMILHPSRLNNNSESNNLDDRTERLFTKLKNAYKEKRPLSYKWNMPSDKENYTYDKISWVDYNDFFGWYIVSSVYTDDLKIKSIEINEILLKISILILVILLLISMILIKKLLKPISIMSDNMNLVKNGQFDIRNNINTNDEIGDLSSHFDNMLDYIEENTKNLEEKIEKRTAEIEYKFYYDRLTGLKNRESLLQNLKNQDFLSLILIDIEEFDNINELYGFHVGNEVLIEVMKLLNTFALKNDLKLYKLDSDIFAIVDLNMGRFVYYEKFLLEIQTLFEKEIHINSINIDIFVYVTMGVSIARLNPLKSSRIALKRAKNLGVKFLVYSEEMDTKDNIEKTMYWREKIKEALENDKVIPFFQPIRNKDEKIIKYEALMRICDEKFNTPCYLAPGSFFEVAIKTKQYFKLNRRIIKKVFDNIDKIGKDVSLNIGFSDILNVDFNEFIEREVNKLSSEQQKKVVFEILESDHISDYKVLDEFIVKYRQKGIRIAIDDFGTGFSNFSHILKIKPDYLKIDGSLIKDINTDENSYQMVKSIVEFSKSLGIISIAEFIHCEEVYNIVRALGIDEFQGYYLGEPISLIE